MKTFRNFLVIVLLLTIQLESTGQNLHTRQANLPCLNKTFSVVVHIARDSLGTLGINQSDIEDAIDSLNVAFEPICASFEVCEFNVIENFQYDTLTNNEDEELLVQYHRANRINIFYIDTWNEVAIECGEATFDGINETQTGGIWILKPCADAMFKTLQYHMGSYFGLLPTFEEEGVELVDGSNCTTNGDLVCDTPADPYRLGDDPAQYVDVGLGCRFVDTRTDANGQFYVPDVGNYMGLYQAECRCGYTYEQYLKMANNYLASDPKMW